MPRLRYQQNADALCKRGDLCGISLQSTAVFRRAGSGNRRDRQADLDAAVSDTAKPVLPRFILYHIGSTAGFRRSAEYL